MLGNKDAAANIAVRDLERANNFINTRWASLLWELKAKR
jgi:hypothetical protein